MCFSSMALSYSAPSFTWHVSPPLASRARKAPAHLPLALVSPSEQRSVMPSMGSAPSFVTAR